MAGCAICTNPFDRDTYDRVVRLGYSCSLESEAPDVLVKDGQERHGARYRIKVCTQCRYDLMGALRRWVDGEFVEVEQREGPADGDCPCCGFWVTQDGRTLRVLGIPGLEILHEQFRVEDSVAMLGTCQDCRGEFVDYVLCAWMAGEFIADGRAINQETRYTKIKLHYDPTVEGRTVRFSPAHHGWPDRERGRVLSLSDNRYQ